MTVAIWPTTHHAGPVPLRAVAVATCALLAMGAAVIHFAILGEHWQEWWGYGLFFGIAAWLQLAWAVAVVARVSRKLLFAGTIANLAIAAIWLLTRTAGIPVGPAAGETESATSIDALATGFEVALALGAFAVAAVHTEQVTLKRWVAGVVVLVVAVGVVTLTTASLIDASSPGGGHNGAESHDGHGQANP